ncbi:MAG: hypothetical protein U0V75_13115 [Ferruginibacter sp.]
MMHQKLRLIKRSVVPFICAVLFTNITKAQSNPIVSNNHLVLPAKTQFIKFYWQGDTINTKWEEHTAILLPVKLKNCPKQFFMQFDLGSPYSLLYKNKLVEIMAKYPESAALKLSGDTLINYSFKIGQMPLLAKLMVLKQFDNSPINWANKNSIEIIGTIGADLIDGKVAIIDYPKKLLIISQAIPAKLKPNLSLTDFIYAQRRILLPAKVNGKQTILYFDTGSSMYELLTDKKTAQSLAVTDAEVVQSKVESWGKYLIVNTVTTKDSIEIGDTKITIRKASFIEGVSNSQAEQMMKMGIGGMTGNKLFLDYKLVIDTKNKKFGLIHSR